MSINKLKESEQRFGGLELLWRKFGRRFWTKMKVTWFLDRACTESLPLPTFQQRAQRIPLFDRKIIREHPIDDRRAIAICVGSKLRRSFWTGNSLTAVTSNKNQKKNWVWRRPVSGDRASVWFWSLVSRRVWYRFNLTAPHHFLHFILLIIFYVLLCRKYIRK